MTGMSRNLLFAVTVYSVTFSNFDENRDIQAKKQNSLKIWSVIPQVAAEYMLTLSALFLSTGFMSARCPNCGLNRRFPWQG